MNTRLGDRAVSLRNQVVDEVRSRIVQGQYFPGERLTEDRVADDLGVSRSPVREALHIVSAEGLVELLHRKGAIVAKPDKKRASEVFVLRSLLEPMSTREAAIHATPADIASLEEINEKAKLALERQEFAEVTRLNSEFHLGVIRASGNQLLHTFARPLYWHVQWIFQLNVSDRAAKSIIEHSAIIEAIASGDPDAAEEAANRHIELAENVITPFHLRVNELR